MDERLIGAWSRDDYRGGDTSITISYILEFYPDGTFEQERQTMVSSRNYDTYGGWTDTTAGSSRSIVKKGKSWSGGNILVLAYEDTTSELCSYEFDQEYLILKRRDKEELWKRM